MLSRKVTQLTSARAATAQLSAAAHRICGGTNSVTALSIANRLTRYSTSLGGPNRFHRKIVRCLASGPCTHMRKTKMPARPWINHSKTAKNLDGDQI